jgi:hypothetical protein
MIQLKFNTKLILTYNCAGWFYLMDILIYGHF